jgi:2'-5' RNA ligase
MHPIRGKGKLLVTDYCPFINDAVYRTGLAGQRYVVLRPLGKVANVYTTVQAAIQARFSDLVISYPAQAHVTLKGFPAGTPLGAVQTLVQRWATAASPLRVEVERVTVFPEPFKIVIVQVRKTAELYHALARLRALAEQRNLPDWPQGTIPKVDEWIFHMSVAYCSTLSAADWSAVASFSESLLLPAAEYPIHEVEIAAFDEGQEYSGGIYPLGQTG